MNPVVGLPWLRTTMLGHQALGERLRTAFIENGLMREGEPERVAKLQGTILTDVDETVAGIKRQHNVFEQLGIDPEEAFGYRILEPLIQLRKDGVRKLGRALGLPAETFERIPFPGPALSARVIGAVTPERVATVRAATVVVERVLGGTAAFQYLAILHEDRVTGLRDGKREFVVSVTYNIAPKPPSTIEAV